MVVSIWETATTSGRGFNASPGGVWRQAGGANDGLRRGASRRLRHSQLIAYGSSFPSGTSARPERRSAGVQAPDGPAGRSSGSPSVSTVHRVPSHRADDSRSVKRRRTAEGDEEIPARAIPKVRPKSKSGMRTRKKDR